MIRLLGWRAGRYSGLLMQVSNLPCAVRPASNPLDQLLT